jgi:hypothetical protein
MMRRVATALLACALSFGGEALARPHGNETSPRWLCYRGVNANPWAVGSYCVDRRGIVEVCVSGGWMSMGECLGVECSVPCPG